MNEMNVLIPETSCITVASRTYQIGKLSVRQFVEMSRFFVDIAGKLKNGVLSTDNNVADFIFLIQALDESDVARLFAILLKEPDAAFVAARVVTDMELCSDIIAAVCRHNDFGKIFGNFQAAAESVKKAVAAPGAAVAPTASLPS